MRPGVEEAFPGRPAQASLKRAETAQNLNGRKKRPVGAGQGAENDKKRPPCAGGGGWDFCGEREPGSASWSGWPQPCRGLLALCHPCFVVMRPREGCGWAPWAQTPSPGSKQKGTKYMPFFKS